MTFKEREFYNNNSYVLIKNYFSEEEAKDIREWALELQNWKETAGKWMIYFESNNDTRLPVRIENFVNYHDNLKKFVNQNLKNKLEEIVEKKVVLFKDKLNWKLAGGSGFKSHQDHPAWNDFPPDMFISMALFVDNNTIENGCLEVSGGLHNYCIYENSYSSGKGINSEVENSMNWESVLATTRDLLIFNSYIPHRSGPNTTDNHRRIYYFTFNFEEEGDFYQQYIAKKRNELPPDIEKDPTKNYNINNKYNLGNPVTYD